MIILHNQKKLRLFLGECRELALYLALADKTGFTGPNDFSGLAYCAVRERLLRHAVKTLAGKSSTKVMNNVHSPLSKKITLVIDESEEIMLSSMRPRVNCNAYTLALIDQLLLQLRPEKSQNHLQIIYHDHVDNHSH